MEEKFSIKIWFSFGIIIFMLLLSGSSVFAVEVVDIEPVAIYRKIGESYIRTDSYYVNKTGIDFHGFDIAPPVPIYSDGDHVSIYIDYEWNVYSNLPFTQNLLVAPRTSATALSVGLGASIFAINPSSSNTIQNFEGNFTWQSSSTCSYNLCLGAFKSADADMWTYSIKGVFDFNLIKEVEMLPIRWGIYINLADYQYSVAGRRVAVKVLDTTTQELIVQGIDEIVSALDNVSLSVDLSSLDTYFNAIINNQISISDAFSELVDSTDVDEDVTKWASQAAVFESKNDYLHQLEESLEGTLEDFEFPTAANQTAVNNVIGFFFGNELVIALALSAMALMVVFLIL